MAKSIKKTSETAGLPPGFLIHVGKRMVEKTNIQVMDYNEEGLSERGLEKIEDCEQFKSSNSTSWINIEGLHETEIMEMVGRSFDIHPLVLEDILNTRQRPKLDDYENYIFITLKMLYFGKDDDGLQFEQVSMILGHGYLITFQEQPGDVFDSVRERIRKSKGKIRRQRADYLAYSLIDAIVDNYFVVLERLSERIEAAEKQVTENPTKKTLKEIHRLKNAVIFIRKSIWPLREVIANFSKEESSLVDERTEIYLRDLYDHIIQAIDSIDTAREMLSGLLDIYLSSINNRLNEVMKVLTIFASIFIPLTFVTGIYGMNFVYMPELHVKIAYPAVLSFMVLTAVIMLIAFKRRGWF